MITSFQEFVNKCRESRWQFTADDLSQDEMNILSAEIAGWTEKTFSAAIVVLHDHYGMEVPLDLLKEIAQGDLDLAQEIYTHGVGDTCQREILSYRVLQKMNMPPWPINGDGEAKAVEFMDKLKAAAPLFGVKILS